MLENILGQNIKYKCSCYKEQLTLNVRSYYFTNKDNPTVTLNFKYYLEQICIAKIVCQHSSKITFNVNQNFQGKI